MAAAGGGGGGGSSSGGGSGSGGGGSGSDGGSSGSGGGSSGSGGGGSGSGASDVGASNRSVTAKADECGGGLRPVGSRPIRGCTEVAAQDAQLLTPGSACVGGPCATSYLTAVCRCCTTWPVSHRMGGHSEWSSWAK